MKTSMITEPKPEAPNKDFKLGVGEITGNIYIFIPGNKSFCLTNGRFFPVYGQAGIRLLPVGTVVRLIQGNTKEKSTCLAYRSASGGLYFLGGGYFYNVEEQKYGEASPALINLLSRNLEEPGYLSFFSEGTEITLIQE